MDAKVTKAGDAVADKDELVADDTTLDLYDEDSTRLSINRYDENDLITETVELDNDNAEAFVKDQNATEYDNSYIVKSSDEEVAKFSNGEVKGEKVGKATFTVYEANGAFLDQIGSTEVEVTVEDSAPAVENGVYKEVEEVTEAEDLALSEVVEDVVVKDTKGMLYQ